MRGKLRLAVNCRYVALEGGSTTYNFFKIHVMPIPAKYFNSNVLQTSQKLKGILQLISTRKDEDFESVEI